MSAQIYVGNISYSMTDESLRKLFEEFGEVVSARVVKDRETDRSRGFAFVEMADPNAAQNAINQLDGSEVMGRNLKVNEARPKN